MVISWEWGGGNGIRRQTLRMVTLKYILIFNLRDWHLVLIILSSIVFFSKKLFLKKSQV